MLQSLSQHLRKLASKIVKSDYSGDSPYLNIPFYQDRTEPEEDSREIGIGPPSMYDEPDESTRFKQKDDMRRQGPRPQPSDRLEKEYERPVTITAPGGEPRENVDGGPWNSITKPRGSDDNNRDTYAPDEGDLTNYDESGDVQL